MNKVIPIILLFVLLCTVGCNDEMIHSTDKSDIIQSYLDVRYDSLTSENYFQRVDEMAAYYSDNLKNNDSWVNNQKNFENTYKLLIQDEIFSEILYKDVVHNADGTYEARIIVKYNTKNVEDTYCAEYTFSVTLEGDKINSFDKVDSAVAFVGTGEIMIENGNIMVVTEPCEEDVCTHDHEHGH